VRIFFSPLTIALDSTDNDITIFIGDGYLSTIRTPFHVLNCASFAVIDHFLYPLSVVFHEDYDGACGVAGGQFAVLVIPDDDVDIACVVRQVYTFVGL
jgi:hypothetical protein